MRIVDKLSPKKLRKLYRGEKISSAEIAKRYHCDASYVRDLLRKYRIKTRTQVEASRLRRKINVSKKELKRLYLGRKMSSPEIAKIYHCSPWSIRHLLKKHRVRMRTKSEAGKLLPLIAIPERELRKLYLEKRMSSPKIAKIYKCDQTTIRRRLNKYGIKIRTASEARINFGGVKVPKEKLRKLYLDKKMTSIEIGKRFKCCERTIFNKLLECEVPIRTVSEASALVKPLYPRKDFDGDLDKRAYLIGLRLGNLSVHTESKNSPTVYVRAGSTKPEFIQLVNRLFSPYGHTWQSTKPSKTRNLNIKCYLNRSFDFLLEKKDLIHLWILANKKHFAAFLAGYTDAEGSFHLLANGKSSAFSIISGEKNILFQIYSKLNKLGILCRPPYINRKKGTKVEGTISTRVNKDLWLLGTCRKDSLLKLIALINPYLKHPKGGET